MQDVGHLNIFQNKQHITCADMMCKKNNTIFKVYIIYIFTLKLCTVKSAALQLFLH